MDLLALPIPSTFEEIRSTYKNFVYIVHSQWNIQCYEQLAVSTENFNTKLNILKPYSDQKNIIRYAMGVGVLGKMHSNYLPKLLDELSSRLPIQDSLASEFVCYLLAKFCKKEYQKDSSFINHLISICSDGFVPSAPRHKVRNSIQLLGRICNEMPETLHNSAQQYIDTLVSGICKLHHDVKLSCYRILDDFLHKSQNGKLIQHIAVSAKLSLVNSKSPDRQQSYLLLLALAANECPETVSNDSMTLMEIAYSFLSSREPYLQTSGMKLLVSLAPLDPLLYRTKYAEDVAQLMFKSGKFSLSRLSIPVFSSFPDTFSMISSDIVSTVIKMFKSNDSCFIESAFLILTEFASTMPLEFGERLAEVGKAISYAPISNEFADHSKTLFTKSNKLWNTVQDNLVKRILKELQHKTLICLKILANCISFNELSSDLLFEPVKSLIESKSNDIRALVPSVLVSLVQDKHSQQFVDLTSFILSHVMNEPFSIVRLKSIEAFKPPDLEVLALPSNLSYFEVLVNDESPKVAQAVFSLLTQIEEYNPMMILPLFRSVILDTLFSSLYSKSLCQQARCTCGRSLILKSSKSILPIYAQVIIPSVLEFLNNKLCNSNVILDARASKLTYFEIQSMNTIAEYFIDIIAVICSIDSKLLKHSLSDIIPLFIKILIMHNDKNVSLAILNAITLLLDTIGINIIDDFPQLVDALYEFGAKETSTILRSNVFKILGKLGSRPPSRVLPQNEVEIYTDLSMIGTTISYPDWFLQVVTTALLELLDEDAHQDVHFKAEEILSTSLHSTSEQIRPFFDKFIHRLLKDVYVVPVDEAPRYFSLLLTVIKTHPEWLKPFASDFSKLIDDMYDTCFLDVMLELIPAIINSFEETFTEFLVHHIPILASILSKSFIELPERAILILNSFPPMSKYTCDFDFIIVNQISSIAYNKQTPTSVMKVCLSTLTSIVSFGNCVPFTSVLYRLFSFVIVTYHDEQLRIGAIKMMNAFVLTLGPNATQLKISIDRFLKANGIQPEAIQLTNEIEIEYPKVFSTTYTISIDEDAILHQTNCDNITSMSDWKNWCNNFILSFISMSPSQVINSCSWIAFADMKFALKIFYAAFLSCWAHLSEPTKATICASIVHCFEDQSTPMSVIVTMVGLAEFMERAEQHMLIPYMSLACAARRSEKLAFAYFCVSKELQKPKPQRSSSAYSHCIDLFSELSLYDDLKGFINLNLPNKKLTPYLAEKLHDWKKAAQLYEEDKALYLPCMLNSYVNLHKYNEIATYFQTFENLQGVVKTQTALSFAKAFFMLERWPMFDKAISYAPKDSIEAIIVQAMGYIKEGKPINDLIDNGFQLIATKAGPLFAHGFSSIAPFIVHAQQLTELGEFANKQLDNWRNRSKRTSLDFQLLKDLYEMRIDLLNADMRTPALIDFLKKARKNADWEVHSIFLNSYFKDFDKSTADPMIVLEHIYASIKDESNDSALAQLGELIERIPPGELQSKIKYKKARFIVRMENRTSIASHLNDVTEICAPINNTKAQYLFAWAHIRLYNMRDKDRKEHAIAAIRAFTKCIALESGTKNSEIQQLTSIIFRSGKYPEVFAAVKDDLYSLTTDKWIPVIPQIFAQMDHPFKEISEFVSKIITKLLDEHHHCTLFHLLFSITSGPDVNIAGAILSEFTKKEPEIVRGAKLFFGGLLKACTTKAELWADALNSMTIPIRQNNMKAMRNILNPLIDELNYPLTDDDRAFAKDHKQMIKKLTSVFREYLKAPKKEGLEELWKICKEIYLVLKKDIEQTTFIDVPSVAPELAAVKDVNIAVPGTYKFGKPVTTISIVGRSMEVLRSKQHPKRLCLRGSNGNEYWYLLKGHEDLRLDQRAMQIFNLINEFIPPQFHHIITYFVMPISLDTGLIEWINGSDTMSKLIRDYRTSHGIQVEKEIKRISAITVPCIDMLLPIQRYEALNEVNEETPDTTLADIMWLKSQGSESWLMKIQTFCQTAAVMSIAGYMLGLGDRHPSNIMINCDTGTVIHIDLGDCFEVTKERVMFPELIPFRLTRFMIRAFGPCGVKGSFSASCESVLEVIRNRRESIMANLEIFVYSPLAAENKAPRREADPSISTLLEVSEKGGLNIEQEVLPINSKPVRTIARIADKLSGREFGEKLSCKEHVNKLIEHATDYYNLAHLYRGWNPLW